MSRGARIAALVAAGVAIVVVAVIAFSVGRLSTLAEPTPGDRSADAGFARDMQVHHEQGVELAMIVRDATDDDDVRRLAYDIATTQGQQAGQMYGWLAAWGLSQAASEPSMTWMTRPGRDGASGHAHETDGTDGSATTDGSGASVDAGTGPSAHRPGDPMPGLATPEQVEKLRAATGVEAERIFLELMIAHHEGAIEMAEAALDRVETRAARALATSIIASQAAEIDLMQQMLDERS